MSNQVAIIETMAALEKPFNKQNAYNMKFESECLFAKQQLVKNDYSVKAAQNSPEALRNAILNVAAIGISLNPALAHSYLVPRSPAKGQPAQICLDVSYRGMIKLATDAGSIKWAKAELVYEGDEFVWQGMTQIPTHEPSDPFADHTTLEGLRGGYCVAQLADGTYLVDRMSAADITKVSNTSKASNGPWKTWPCEMAKKTLIKRASKSWPQSAGRSRLDQAIAVVNEHEGLAEENTVVRQDDFMRPTPEQTARYLELASGESAVEFYLWFYQQDERLRPSLPGCEFEKGTKMKTMARFNDRLKEGQQRYDAWVVELQSMCERGDEDGVAEFLDELTEMEADGIKARLNTEHSMFVQRIAEAA